VKDFTLHKELFHHVLKTVDEKGDSKSRRRARSSHGLLQDNITSYLTDERSRVNQDSTVTLKIPNGQSSSSSNKSHPNMSRLPYVLV
jgi:hypothetical protein